MKRLPDVAAKDQILVSIASKGRFVGFITNRFYQGHIKWCGNTFLVK
jgi:hypothetical protein